MVSRFTVIPLERVGELRKVESRANFVATKQQSDDQTVEATDRSGGPATLNGPQFRLFSSLNASENTTCVR